MKKFLSLLIVATLLCVGLVIGASMAEVTDGLYFNDINLLYTLEKDFDKDPLTVEAVVYFDKAEMKRSDGGVLFGNYNPFDDTTRNFNIYIADNGKPAIKVRIGGTIFTHIFKTDSIYINEWVHLAIVRDFDKKQFRCYINGELADSVDIPSHVVSSSTRNFKIGGDNSYTNSDYFRGAIKSLTLYSDVRTDAEIKKDVTKLDKSGLLAAYDFSSAQDRPKVVTDLSSNKNNAHRNRMVYDEPIIDPSTYAYTIAVIGDTQMMAHYYPDHMKDIYNYIYDNIDTMNIEAVIGLGDITDTKSGEEKEWVVSLEALKIIDDVVLNIPITGNHDVFYWYKKTMAELNYSEFAIPYRENDPRTTYYATEIGGVPYLFVQLTNGPTDDALAWASGVIAAHPDHHVIVSTHVYLTHDGTTIDKNDMHQSDVGNQGDAIWDKLIKKHDNIVLVLSGHIGWDYVVTTQRKGDNGNIVTEMLLDFQSTDNAAVKYSRISDHGMGIVNFFHFSADGKTVTVETISTVLGKKFMEANQFTINLPAPSGKTYVKPDKAPTPPRELPKTEIKMTINSTFAYVNGEKKVLDAAPIIKNSRTLLPVRFLAENLGAEVVWNDATKTATLATKDITIEVTVGASSMKVNGAAVALDSPAIIENSRTYLPLRAIANALGVSNDNITWDDSTKTATFVK